ncbi:MAG: MAPEG family protein [Hyphomicrobiaceae bacterium]
MPITALYAGLLGPLLVVLAVRVIDARRAAKVALGDGGQPLLLRRMRAHANFAEYVPLALLLLALAESLATFAAVLHAAGLALVAGRAVHAFGVSQSPERLILRVTGMALTLTAVLVLSAACLFGAIRGLI